MGASEFLCPLTNISQCALTETDDNLVMLIYNPLTRPISKMIRFPVVNANIKIFDGQTNEEIYKEFIPIGQFIVNIPGRDSKSEYDVVFEANNIPPLGYKTYYLEKSESVFHDQILQVKKLDSFEDVDIYANIGYYQGSGQEPQPSGAYIFRY